MKRFLMRLFGLTKEIDALINEYDKLSDFVWHNAKLMDQNGIADQDYDSKVVSDKWAEYHNLNQSFRNKARLLR